jgi:hypothetical protein
LPTWVRGSVVSDSNEETADLLTMGAHQEG